MKTKLTVSFIVHEDFSHIWTALSSLYSSTELPVQVYLTVNSGLAPEVEALQRKYPDIKILVNETRRGFAANHNAILRLAQTPYIALLNDDIQIHAGALDTLVRFLEDHQDVGLVGPLIVFPDGSPHLSSFSDPSLFRMLYVISGLSSLTRHGGLIRHTLQWIGIAQRLGVDSLKTDQSTRPVPVIVGVSMVVRRAAYEEAGLMDETTVVFGEEFGWHWRLRQHGWRIYLVAEAQVTHFNLDQEAKGWKLVEHRKGILGYFVRYRPRWQAALIRAALLTVHSVGATVAWALRREDYVTHRKVLWMALTLRK
ncbi:MAG: glycosyltransferase [Anaerolineae bacterium]|nr:glycosyltransferase [Anaerolineae bacterium]